ncbi:MAG: Rrf2 family transcriptional regulator [Hyphomicrobiaceae bacterium]|nr:Rrf2 family transcriptional regulator [Hyphomicrobiaceae bacterium]
MAMADLAKFGGEAAVALPAIAERQKLPVAYLEQIFGQLRQARLVESVRGRSGGYKLARAADAITVSEVMIAVEEATRMTRCSLGGSDGGCVGDERCITHGLWHALGSHIESFLSRVTLAEVVDGHPARLLSNPPVRQVGGLAAE